MRYILVNAICPLGMRIGEQFMKIGLQTNSLEKNAYGRWGDNAYKKIKEHGFSCIDFNLANTETEIYTSSLAQMEKILLRERELTAEAGIEISQVHGPWRWPAKDLSDCCHL